MEFKSSLDVFKEYKGKILDNYPKLVHSRLYNKVLNNLYIEISYNKANHLFSPNYTSLTNNEDDEIENIVNNNPDFFNSLKEFMINSLFVYSAILDENSPSLINTHSIVIARLIHNRDQRFEVKFYTHYEDELLKNYSDKIYLGRDFINLIKFPRKYLGLKKYLLSLKEQNEKLQERAKHKLRYIEEYRKSDLNEIDYTCKELFKESMEIVKSFRETSISEIRKDKSQDVLSHLIYIASLFNELHDSANEFEIKLRQHKEYDFAKYITKFNKDLIDSIWYLKKLSYIFHLKISNYKID